MNYQTAKYQTTKLSLLAILLAFSASVQAEETTTKVSTGLFYSSGQSSTTDTTESTSWSVPLMLTIRNEKLSFGVSTSYLSVESAGVTTSGGSDTTLSIGYDLMEMPWVTVKIKEKFATGDAAKGLSTGKEDTSVQIEYFQPLSTSNSVFTTLGYKFVGKVTGTAMKDSTYASIGTGYSYPNQTNIGVSLDYSQSIFTSLDDQIGLSFFMSKPLSKTLSLSGFVGYDNTKTSSAGTSITAKF